MVNLEFRQLHDAFVYLKALKRLSDFTDKGPVVQSIISLTSSLRGQLIKCFVTL